MLVDEQMLVDEGGKSVGNMGCLVALEKGGARGCTAAGAGLLFGCRAGTKLGSESEKGRKGEGEECGKAPGPLLSGFISMSPTGVSPLPALGLFSSS